MLKTLIRQWLCEHKKTSLVQRIVTQKDRGEVGKEPEILKIKIWSRCVECRKIIFWEN